MFTKLGHWIPFWATNARICVFSFHVFFPLRFSWFRVWVVCSSYVSCLTCSVRLIFSNYVILLGFIASCVFRLQGSTKICSPISCLSSKRTSFLRWAAGKTQNLDRGYQFVPHGRAPLPQPLWLGSL
jgi:hypothetical protein